MLALRLGFYGDIPTDVLSTRGPNLKLLYLSTKKKTDWLVQKVAPVCPEPIKHFDIQKFTTVNLNLKTQLLLQNKRWSKSVYVDCRVRTRAPSRCLKTAEKFSFHNIAREASYVYLLDKSSLKNAKNGQFDEFLKNWSLRSNSDTRQVNFDKTLKNYWN